MKKGILKTPPQEYLKVEEKEKVSLASSTSSDDYFDNFRRKNSTVYSKGGD